MGKWTHRSRKYLETISVGWVHTIEASQWSQRRVFSKNEKSDFLKDRISWKIDTLWVFPHAVMSCFDPCLTNPCGSKLFSWSDRAAGVFMFCRKNDSFLQSLQRAAAPFASAAHTSSMVSCWRLHESKPKCSACSSGFRTELRCGRVIFVGF